MIATPQTQAPSRRALLLGLKSINALICSEVERFREHEKGNDSLKGLVIQEEEVDKLLAQLAEDGLAERETSEAERLTISSEPASRWTILAQLFQLQQCDLACILICLAPELDRRYELLYAYLQDDITRRRPSIALCMDLLFPQFAWKLNARLRFAASAPLFHHCLLERFDDPSQLHSTLLAQCLRVDERIVSFLLGSDEIDSRLANYVRKIEPAFRAQDTYISPEIRTRLEALASAKDINRLVVYLQGGYGTGSQEAAKAFCQSANIPLLRVNLKALAGLNEAEYRTTVELIIREARLQSAALYWHPFDVLLSEGKDPLLASLFKSLESFTAPVFLSGKAVFEPRDELEDARFVRVQYSPLSTTERLEVWRTALPEESGLELGPVSAKFRFTPGQIRNAVQSARSLAFARDPQRPKITIADIYEACRLQSNRKLSTLSRKIPTRDEWSDLVLPADRLQQLKEICNSVKYRSLVYEDWGFERKLCLARGINILLSGPPGTGKTMAASIIAGKLGLELYKTDLSSLVSKYIGETEKNLAKIFAEAETSNAILFFDEADALFGRRSEVRDSHDRYANIEVNYLLQKMEEHEGVVMLATNFRKNIDEAFVRRLHFTIDFPFPDEADRLRIWETIWPKETPGHAEMDFQSIARRFAITGGNIRNIALSAAFLAADNGGSVNMKHLLQATRREYQKMGKVVNHGEFDDEHESESVN